MEILGRLHEMFGAKNERLEAAKQGLVQEEKELSKRIEEVTNEIDEITRKLLRGGASDEEKVRLDQLLKDRVRAVRELAEFLYEDSEEVS